MPSEPPFVLAAPERISGYHAHIYYDAGDPASRDRAARLRDKVERGFAVVMGRWRDFPVGPHPQSMYQVAFAPELFAAVVPFLMTQRDGLSVLVHPETGHAYNDHMIYSLWLGPRLALREDVLREISEVE